MSGRHVKAMMARLALLEASPAFNPTNDVKTGKKQLNTMPSYWTIMSKRFRPRTSFYEKEQADNDTHQYKKDLPEILWRRPIYSNRRERAQFPAIPLRKCGLILHRTWLMLFHEERISH